MTTLGSKNASGSSLPGFLNPILLAGAILATAGLSMGTFAQNITNLKKPERPLVLASTGSFFIGGTRVSQTPAEIGLYGGGPIMVDQMYVQYMVPEGRSKVSVVMIHGGTLSGKSYETTPDGRMGWYEYFARRAYPTYVVDQIGRARSGFNQAPFNDVRTGNAPPASQPTMRRVAADVAWVRFRFGPSPGVPFADTQFPVEAAAEFEKQGVPDIGENLTANSLNYQALADLGNRLGGAILIGHSQSARFPLEAALLDPNSVRAAVVIEPPGCNSTGYTDAQITTLSRTPILVVFGDHLDTPQRVGVSPLNYFDDCKTFIRRINAAGGRAAMLHPVELGIHGNSHMIMLDRNNIQIADLIINWLRKPTR